MTMNKMNIDVQTGGQAERINERLGVVNVGRIGGSDRMIVPVVESTGVGHDVEPVSGTEFIQ